MITTPVVEVTTAMPRQGAPRLNTLTQPVAAPRTLTLRNYLAYAAGTQRTTSRSRWRGCS